MPPSTWLVHASREPHEAFLAEMGAWWREAADFSDSPASDRRCLWRDGPLHTLVHVHVDRAAHKRRRRVLYVSRQECPGVDYGMTAMSSLVPDDAYGAEPWRVEHAAPGTALAHAYAAVADQPNLLSVPVLTEAEFDDPEWYQEHASSHMNPLKGGVVLPFLLVPRERDILADKDAAADREDLLRAHGFSSYSVDVDLAKPSLDMHRELAMLLEDVCDEIAAIKADAEARVLSDRPLWPIIVLRSSTTWEYQEAAQTASLAT